MNIVSQSVYKKVDQMVDNIKLQVVTPEKVVINEEIKSVRAPGSLGEFGVLIGHTPFLSSLQLGSIYFEDINEKEQCAFIKGGFAEVLPNKVTILAEAAEKREGIDLDRAQKSLERANQRLDEDKQEADREIDLVRAKAALFRALQRIKIVENKKID